MEGIQHDHNKPNCASNRTPRTTALHNMCLSQTAFRSHRNLFSKVNPILPKPRRKAWDQQHVHLRDIPLCQNQPKKNNRIKIALNAPDDLDINAAAGHYHRPAATAELPSN